MAQWLFKLFIIMVAGAAMLMPAVSASDQKGLSHYKVSPGSEKPSGYSILSYGTITQGETDWYSRYVPGGVSSMTVDLNWGDTSDSLALTIIAPDATLGPYYDANDGSTDGRICLQISGGLTSGTWNFRIYGASVQGTEDYTFDWY